MPMGMVIMTRDFSRGRGGARGLSDYELTISGSFRDIHIVLTSEFRGDMLRETTSSEYTQWFKNDAVDLEFRGDFVVYFRDIARCMENEVGNDIRWGGGIHLRSYPKTDDRRKRKLRLM